MKTPFAEHDGVFFVTIAASGIHYLIPLIDGMRVVHFGKETKPYLRLDDAIAWHEKEIEESHGTSGSKKALGLLKQARERLTANAANQARSEAE